MNLLTTNHTLHDTKEVKQMTNSTTNLNKHKIDIKSFNKSQTQSPTQIEFGIKDKEDLDLNRKSEENDEEDEV